MQRILRETREHPRMLPWLAAHSLLVGSRHQEFLNSAWVDPLLQLVPGPWRRHTALRLLGQSPHYFIQQWTDAYPNEWSRPRVLEAEAERMRASRRQICQSLLEPHLRPHMTVLDFGCGPGFLAAEVAQRVCEVFAVDVSRGALACARVLNSGPNLVYLANGRNDIPLPRNSIDLIYSIAVLQHLQRSQVAAFVREFARLLRPGARLVLHVPIGVPGAARGQCRSPNAVGRFLDRYRLYFDYFSEEELRVMLERAGFHDILIRPVSAAAEIEDELGQQHLITADKVA